MGKAKWIEMRNALTMENPHAYHLTPNIWQGMVRRQRLNGDWCAIMDIANPSMLKIQSGS